jgi:prenyl protein peptidase
MSETFELVEICVPQRIEAIAFSVAVTSGYVGMLFLSFNSGDRDAPRTIASRLLSSVVLAGMCEGYVRTRWSEVDPLTAIGPSGFRDHASAALASIALTLLLYAGHFLARTDPWVASPRELYSLWKAPQRWLSLRSYVMAPLVEEIVFRQQALLMWRCFSLSLRILGPALLFGAAHLHHARTNGIQTAFIQFGYTSLFGLYAAVLWLNSGTLAAPLAAHVMCNCLELPDFDAISRHSRSKTIATVNVAALVLFCYTLGNSRALFRNIYI